MSGGIGRCPVFLLEVALSTGGNATSITVKGSKWGDYFIYDDTVKSWRSFSTQIIIGDHTSTDNTTSIGVGARAGLLSQSATAVAVGQSAGNANQGDGSVAVGQYAGIQSQQGVAVGSSAGEIHQQIDTVAVGYNAGQNNQHYNAVAVGANAGQYSQQTSAIAIGANAGQYSQTTGAIAIGYNAGQTNQGANSIAIGYNSNAGFQSIVIDASYSTPINAGATGVFIRPVVGPKLGSNLLSWDMATKEIFYNGSSQRYKYDIQDLTETLSIDKLQPREFKYKLDNSPDIGLIAEEAYKCDNAFAYLDKTQIPEGIQWNAITVALLKELQQMKKRIQILQTNNK
jgi:hypothetical protein